MEDQIWGEVRRRKMEDRKMEDQLSFICTHYFHKTVTHQKSLLLYKHFNCFLRLKSEQKFVRCVCSTNVKHYV